VVAHVIWGVPFSHLQDELPKLGGAHARVREILGKHPGEKVREGLDARDDGAASSAGRLPVVQELPHGAGQLVKHTRRGK